MFLIAEGLIILRKMPINWGNWSDNISKYAVSSASYITDGLIGQTLHVVLKFRSWRINSTWTSTFLAFYTDCWGTCHFHYIFYFILFFIMNQLLLIKKFIFFILLDIFHFLYLAIFILFNWLICILLYYFLGVDFIWVLLQMKNLIFNLVWLLNIGVLLLRFCQVLFFFFFII